MSWSNVHSESIVRYVTDNPGCYSAAILANAVPGRSATTVRKALTFAEESGYLVRVPTIQHRPVTHQPASGAAARTAHAKVATFIWYTTAQVAASVAATSAAEALNAANFRAERAAATAMAPATAETGFTPLSTAGGGEPRDQVPPPSGPPLTVAGLRVLVVLAATPGRGVNDTLRAASGRKTRSPATTVIAAVEAAGYVRRERLGTGVADRLYLTDAGRLWAQWATPAELDRPAGQQAGGVPRAVRRAASVAAREQTSAAHLALARAYVRRVPLDSAAQCGAALCAQNPELSVRTWRNLAETARRLEDLPRGTCQHQPEVCHGCSGAVGRSGAGCSLLSWARHDANYGDPGKYDAGADLRWNTRPIVPRDQEAEYQARALAAAVTPDLEPGETGEF